eukprot:GDKJ01004338.1.p1 GENE.GDKJ01004338.1~~GDKJ01004338.1.p1  ORF type:complete len:303 (-),score=4.64 GDKJ01004338.1:2756-3643(-)
MKRSSILLLALFFGKKLAAQNLSTTVAQPTIGKSLFNNSNKRNFSRKGEWFLYWGWNFSTYDTSDLTFTGPGYDFTLKDITAKDRPSKLSTDYINPLELTTPQFNFRFGFFIKDNYSISLGWDHMKYVMDIPQTVKVDGYINTTISNPAIATGTYAGAYNNTPLTIKSDMLTFEHTDGFNYVSTEVERYDDIWVAKNQQNMLTMETGVGAGFMIPRTDVRLFGVGENNFWNFAGYGVSLKAGLKFHFTKKFYLQNTTKIGYTDLWAIHTTGRNDIDKASQTIRYLENFTALGFQF